MTPAMLPATVVGTDRFVVASRTAWPATVNSPSWVSNAASTWAAVPAASMVIRSADTDPTVKPSWSSQAWAAETSAGDGEYWASHWAVVR